MKKDEELNLIKNNLTCFVREGVTTNWTNSSKGLKWNSSIRSAQNPKLFGLWDSLIPYKYNESWGINVDLDSLLNWEVADFKPSEFTETPIKDNRDLSSKEKEQRLSKAVLSE